MPVQGAQAHVLVLYRRSSKGEAALKAAAGLACESDARLTVLTFARTERANRRCCGVSATYWNAVICELADQDLRHAADIIGRTPRVEFAVTAGSSQSSVLAREAAERRCDLLVLPRAGRRLRRALSRQAGCPVLELPAAAGTQVAGAAAR